jgi:ketosteroid isomerase-like protein
MLRHFSFRPLSTRCLMAAAVLIGVAAGQFAGAQHPKHMKPKRAARETVEAMEEQWRLAELNDDAPAMDALLSDDFVGITAFGQVNTKAQQLDRMRDRDAVLTSLTLSDIKVKLIGPVAVVTSRAEVKGTNDGVPMSGFFRYTRVYQRLAGGPWKITSFEATPARGDNPKPRAEAHPAADVTPTAKP